MNPEDSERNFLVCKGILLGLRNAPEMGDVPLIRFKSVPYNSEELRSWVENPENLRRFAYLLRSSVGPAFYSCNLFHGLTCDRPSEAVDGVNAVLRASMENLRDSINQMDIFPSVFSRELVARGDRILSEISELMDDVRRETDSAILTD